MHKPLAEYILTIADNSLILAHRLSELCGHGPSLETDIALTNMSLDLFGQVRSYFQYAASLSDHDKTEDDIAFLRLQHEYKNVLLVEQPNTDFAYVMARQFFFDAFHLPFLQLLQQSNDSQLSAIADKAVKEVKYHIQLSSDWVIRLGDGTEESHNKMQAAVDYLFPYVGEFFEVTPVELDMKKEGIGVDLQSVKASFDLRVKEVLGEATLIIPENTSWHQSGGKKGIHTEHMGSIMAELQYMQRAYPGMEW